ncbi:hypothetical protein SAMD00019534_060690 [Acytostelium subglobosum LB1]|uniref:hypothetical protein n=1 Tax=Acytostelium subglobosum LB1 TaxID=1410327 RepID=UPI000644FB66|nr:hypothetical protein SAMD00019534_060690 [Acytostelium subglobosum LB1]GAM22894.1 hypothetical protein SAMD00019534_060690 [Acytostelium subglobosum LB1]|eukprot:XP_012754121.1 hypothetical protein SAMD00019534_060690 [Acytostelium subglobosum LB1]
MNIIINNHNNSNGNAPSYTILEFQGCFEDTNPSKLANETLGDLTLKGKDTYQLVIGNQVFEGKETKLKKPLLIIQQQQQQQKQDISDNDNGDDSNMQDDTITTTSTIIAPTKEVEYQVKATVYSKICFTSRPATTIPQQSVKYGSPQQRRSPSSSPQTTPDKTSSSAPASVDQSSSTDNNNDTPIPQPKFT